MPPLLCCRGAKVEEAFQAILTASVSDKDLFKQRYDDLVAKEKMLLAMKDKLLAGGQGPRLASTPNPADFARASSCMQHNGRLPA